MSLQNNDLETEKFRIQINVKSIINIFVYKNQSKYVIIIVATGKKLKLKRKFHELPVQWINENDKLKYDYDLL